MPLGSFPFGGAPLGSMPVFDAGGGGVVPLEGDYTLTIGATTDAVKYVPFNGYRKSEQANGRNTLNLTMFANDGYRPTRGEAVTFKFGDTLLFAGQVFSRTVTFAGNHVPNGYLAIDVQCVDWNAIADRRLIGEVYEQAFLHAIYADIVNNILAEEGVMLGSVQDGPLVDKVVFNNITVRQALDILFDETGYYWEIDYTKSFNAGPRTVHLAPFQLNVGSNAVLLDFRDEETLEQYRNVQVIEGGNGITEERTESFPGDGETRTWTLEYPAFDIVKIDIDGAEVSLNDIGVRGVDEGKRFYWAQGDNTIGHDKDDPVVPVNDTLNITYRGLFKIITKAQDAAAIANRQAIEGGSGKYENIVNEGELDGEEVVQQRALGLLRRYSLGSDVVLETDADGLMVGQQVTVNIAQLGIVNVPYLITGMETTQFGYPTRRYAVRATTGELRGTFAEFWKRVFKRNPIRNREQAILSQLDFFPESLGLGSSETITLQADVVDEWGTAIIGETEWG